MMVKISLVVLHTAMHHHCLPEQHPLPVHTAPMDYGALTLFVSTI